MKYNFNQLYDRFTKAKIKKEIIADDLISLEKELEKHKELRFSIEEAQIFLQKIAQDTQNQLKYHIEEIVQLAIDTCFPGEYEFRVNFEISRGKTEARLIFLDDGEEVNPLKESGGGVADMAALGLRIATWILGRARNTIVLDEPFRFVSNDLQEKASEVLKEIAEKLKLQFIIVTHRPEIIAIADRVFEIKNIKNGNWSESEISILKSD